MTVENATECLIAAAFIVINTFACKRISEVLSLTVNCSRPSLDGGWEVVFGLRKASPTEALSLIGRPIPDVAQMAIDLLIDLYPKSTIQFQDNPDSSPLFLSNYNVSRENTQPIQCGEATIYRRIELFADVIEISPDEEGCRWYVRSHELRRFFAIAYFWHDKFTGLPALSWFMGHNDIEQTMHYVTEEIAGKEMSEEEARYSVSVLLGQDKGLKIKGMDMLITKATEHFSEENFKVVDERLLEEYLKECFDNGYRIVKHGYEERIIYLEEFNDN